MLGVTRLSTHITSLIKIFLIIVTALYAPQLCIYLSYLSSDKQYKNFSNIPVVPGLEKVDALMIKKFLGSNSAYSKIALFTNEMDTSTVKKNNDLLLRKGISINAVINTVMDSGKKNENNEKNNDVFLIDMHINGTQDVCSTLFNILTKASELHKKVIILDRPNPLGHTIEDFGLLIKKRVGASVPLRHGMTIGELAHYFTKNMLNKSVSLMVVPIENYHRQASAELFKQSKVGSNKANDLHNFLQLIKEISPFEVSRQSKTSINYFALPDTLNVGKQKWYYVKRILKTRGIESTFFRHFNQQKKQFYSGLSLVKNEHGFVVPSAALLDIIEFFAKEKIAMKVSKNFDTSVGSQLLRSFIEGKITRKKINQEVNQQLSLFFHKARNSFIYSPLPKISYI